jgi:hypothetical protein
MIDTKVPISSGTGMLGRKVCAIVMSTAQDGLRSVDNIGRSPGKRESDEHASKWDTQHEVVGQITFYEVGNGRKISLSGARAPLYVVKKCKIIEVSTLR